ncbi:Probable 2-oxoglutarate-dependent dioxygenase AOP1.2 [Linum grandiflorum]
MIPVVDLSIKNLIPGTKTWFSTCNEVRKAMEEYGYFKAIFHDDDSSSSTQLHDDVFAAAEELFSLPTETKMKNTSCKPYFDYFGQHPVFPLNESLAVDHPTSSLATRSFAGLMWPAGNVSFCKATVSFAKVMAELDRTVIRMIFESYRIADSDDYNEYYLKAANHVLRFYRYTVPKPGQSNVGLGCHTDKSLISILRQSVGGLQVKSNGGEWVDVEMSPSSFLVMAGDALMAWSNGRIKSCEHQVIMKEKVIRYSVGLSTVINGMVYIPKEMGYYDEDDVESKPFRYKSFDHFGLLEFIRSKKAKNYDTAIQEYCGIV